MRSDKHKLSQPPRLKSNPKLLPFNEPPNSDPSDRSGLDECEPIFLNKNKSAFDEASFKAKYERALDLITKKKQADSRNALTILDFLCGEIHKLPEKSDLSYELLENVVINCWRLKNSFKEEALPFIRSYVEFFAETYRREKVHKNGLHLLFLIQANEQFDEGLFADALRSCELSIRHCGSVKNQGHLLKVEYLKCNIYNAQGNTREEAEVIKRCLFYINTLIATISEEGFREDVNQLKKNLLARDAFLKDNPNHQKNLDSKKPSFSLFRKRLLSHKRQDSQKEITAAERSVQKKPQRNQMKESKRPLVRSIHTRSANISKYNPGRKEDKATFLPVDLTKFNKPEEKIKKKPLKITDRNRANDFQESRGNVMDQIDEMAPVSFNYESLMVRRPNQPRKQSLRKPANPGEGEQVGGEEISIQQMMVKKQSNRSQQEQKIEPVTHYIAKSMHSNDEVVEQEQEELVRECVKDSEEGLLKIFLRKLTQEEEIQFNEKPIINASNHPSRVDIESSDSSSNDFKPKAEEPPELALNLSQTNNHFEYLEPEPGCESNFNLSESLQLVTYAGILSRFKFSIKTQKKQHLDEAEQFYKQLYINFCAVMNRRHHLHASLAFRYYNPFENNLQIILDEICKNELDYVTAPGESIKHKLLNLIANRLLLVKRQYGLVLLQKEKELVKDSTLTSAYTNHLRDSFIIYEENKLTSITRAHDRQQRDMDYTAKRNRENAFRVQAEKHLKQKKEQLNGSHEILSYFLPKLIRRMTDDLKEEKSSLSSVKRMKTERFYKDTILSFKSLIKSMNESELNARVMFDDQKSLSYVMPSDFNSKISNFFEHEEGSKETSIYEFYYCMKFILIQPAKAGLPDPAPAPTHAHAPSKRKQRRITIERAVRESEKECEMVKPKYLQDTLSNFYDMVQVEHLFRLRGVHAHITMTCFKVKEVFKKTEEYFYKFEMQFKGERIKMMKFIATSYDIYLLVSRRAYQLKSSRKKEKLPREDYQIPAFNRFSLLALLKEISQRIFVKKDYIYSIIGVQGSSSHFNYINKFRLQGKTVQNKQFMIPHLRYIHILLQKSIKIICDHFREYAVLTIRQIERSSEFNVIFYLPAHQRTYSINLNRTIVHYLHSEHRTLLFADSAPRTDEETLRALFDSESEGGGRGRQRQLWSNFSKLFKFEVHYYEDRMHMLLRIGSYVAFLKDCCFSEFFQLKDKIFHLEMSLARKSQPTASEFELRHARHVHPKRKSASSKELIKRNNFMVGRDMKCSGRPLKPSIAKQCAQEELFRKGDLFDRLSKIYETDTAKYVVYVALTRIYEIAEGGQREREQETRKVNFSFCLSDLLSLLKESKKELCTREQKLYNEFNEEVFSFAILLRAMTIIKYRLINELKRFRELDQLFEGENTVSLQKQFKNSLVLAFCSQNENLYSLNSSQRLYRLENNIYLINKSLMAGRRSAVVSIFYDQKGRKIKFYLTNVAELANKQKMYFMREMKFPWIEFYRKEQLFKVSTRIYKYYKNILLFT